MRGAFRLLVPLQVLRAPWTFWATPKSATKARLGARLSRYLKYHAERQQPWRVNFAFAKVSEQVHGYGHVKAWRLAAARTQWDLWVKRFHRTQAQAA
jgi:hypothetical protein